MVFAFMVFVVLSVDGSGAVGVLQKPSPSHRHRHPTYVEGDGDGCFDGRRLTDTDGNFDGGLTVDGKRLEIIG